MTESLKLEGPELDQLCINTVRTLAMDAVQRAKSGHPGTAMALAPLGYVLFTEHLRHNPSDPGWIDRDRFVLSNGHCSILLYSLLYLTGYELVLDDLKQYRQWGSKTPGHPEYGHTPGVETTTGPLGQGFANAVGMAIAETHLAATFNMENNPVIDHRTWFIASDGDLMEGISHEAASLAGRLGLNKLIGFYDDNHITIEGDTALAFDEDVATRFESYRWHVQRVEDGNDLRALNSAIEAAKENTSQPSLIIVRTHIAYGSPNAVDTSKAHGSPLGEEEVRLTKTNLDWPTQESFFVPDEALDHWRKALIRGKRLQSQWQEKWNAFTTDDTSTATELKRRLDGKLPHNWDQDIPVFPEGDAMATRVASGKVLNAIAARVPELMGGAADLAPSTNTLIEDAGDFATGAHDKRNMHFGIREHAMGGVLSGMALHGGIVPYGATFLIFSDYMRPSIRLAALMRQHVIYIFTHDSIGLGEDGPTHQPVEQLTALRAIPGLIVLRPADANETAAAWRIALTRQHGPVAMALTRQPVPTLAQCANGRAEGLSRGAYVLADADKESADAILLASGSEVSLALEARTKLLDQHVDARVVSAPSLELFAQQPAGYRDEVLPPGVKLRVAIEAALPMPWQRWVGDAGAVIGIDRFGASAPYERIYKEYGLTADAIVEKVLSLRQAITTSGDNR